MFRESIIGILNDIWPMVFICCFIVSTLRIIYLLKNQKDFILYKELINLFFILYIMCLFRVVTFEDVSFSSFNITLFKEMFRYKFGSKLFFKNVIGNTIMFIPFGFFVTYILKEKKLYIPLLITASTSAIIELTQYQIGRVFDVDDIVLNIIGGVIGFAIYHLLIKIVNVLPLSLKKNWFYNIISIALIFLFVLYLLGDFVCLK